MSATGTKFRPLQTRTNAYFLKKPYFFLYTAMLILTDRRLAILPKAGHLRCVLRKHLGVGLILGLVPIQNSVFRNDFKQSYL